MVHLGEHEEIDPDELALSFSQRYFKDPRRGFGGAMHSLLPKLRFGDWEDLSSALFGGSGSFGNGAAMRSAPIGAYFADSVSLCVEAAELCSRITHFHPEGVAGGIAVAVAACLAAQARESRTEIDLIEEVLPLVPGGLVKSGLERAKQLEGATLPEAAETLGTGQEVSAHDTVPFCLWCTSRNLNNYEEALWETVAGLGDRDTTCAIVGGIVAARTGVEGIPSQWLQSREALDLE